MTLQFHPIAVIYFSSFAIALFMALSSRRIPPVRGARIWSFAMAFCAVWSLGDGLEILMGDLFWKLVFIRLSYVGVVGTAMCWSAFAVIYSNNERLLTPTAKFLLSILPVATLVAVFTLHLHPWFYQSVGLVTHNGHASLATTYGSLFKVWAVYAYGAIFGGGVLLIQAILRFPQQFHGQIYLLVMAAVIPLVSNFLFITGHNFISPFDPSAPAFVVSGLLVSVNLRRFRFLNIVPVAHDLVFRHVDSGVVVVDTREHILALNPAGERMTGCRLREVFGRQIGETELKAFYPERDVLEEKEGIAEVRVGEGVYEVQVTPMTDRAGRETGTVILLYDITALKASEKKLSDAYDQLQKVAARDPLTGLFNRGHFLDMAERALTLVKRRTLSFSLMLIDLDHFKAVNDTQGHLLGDEVLRETARCLTHYSRKGDILGRYGGDEFVVMAYEADEAQAGQLAQRYCSEIAPALARLEGMSSPVTLSIGIAVCDKGEKISFKALLDRADQALYRAKNSGRNRVSVWRAD